MQGTERLCAYPNRFYPPTKLYGFTTKKISIWVFFSAAQTSNYMHTYTHIHTCIHTYLHTYVHIHTHTRTCMHYITLFYLHTTHIHIGIHKYIHFFFHGATAPSGPWLLIFEASRLHSVTHTRYDSSGGRISPTQRPLHSQEADIHKPCGIRTHNPSKWAAVDPPLRPRGHWDRLNTYIQAYIHTSLRYRYILHTYRDTYIHKGSVNIGRQVARAFLIFVSPPYGTSFISPDCRLELWGGWKIIGKFVSSRIFLALSHLNSFKKCENMWNLKCLSDFGRIDSRRVFNITFGVP